MYTPLFCKSNYAFLEGASHPEELITTAHELGLPALAITDRDGVYGIVRGYVRAKELGFKLIVGAEITIDDGSQIVLLAMNHKGYTQLCRLISTGRLRCSKGQSLVSWNEICEHATGLIALWGGKNAIINHEAEPIEIIDALKQAFSDRLYALLIRHREPKDALLEQRTRERANKHNISTVAGMEVLYHEYARRPLQDIMTCIRHGVNLGTAGTLLKPNAEHAIKSSESFNRLYKDDPESIARTLEITDRCTFCLSQLRYRYPSEKLPDGSTTTDHLKQLTHKGALSRYPNGIPHSVLSQIEKELRIIRDLEYDGYFLTMYEIVGFCREHDILCQGRGSAANSTVCFCLGITAVDPVRMGLLFERFISKERAEPPDIDLDIEHNRREEVIQYMYAKYGRNHAAMVANFIRYRARSAIRDVGKALAFPETSVERFAKLLSHYSSLDEETMKMAGFDPENRRHHLLLKLALEIQDAPRHLSIHPGGFLLGHYPVKDLVPLENATMEDRTVIQWDKNDVEDLGLFKVDLLGLGALNVVHRSFDLIRKHTGRILSLATVPARDEATYAMIRKADTVGLFQIESRAQMSMLPRLQPRNYYDLVIEVSIVRPGPIAGGMVHPYLRRRNGEEAITYPHPILKPILEKTLGIPLFQEQVMQLAMAAADYTPGEADQLRRDMAAWKKYGRIDRHRELLIQRMGAKGIKQEFAEQIFEQIRGFGEYGFPESHAASFALIAYVTGWLKCHYPAAYLCAMLNAQPMGFYSPATLVEDARRHGVEIRPIDVQHSDWDCLLEPTTESGEGFAVRMGLRYVKSLNEADLVATLAQRPPGGFRDLQDFKDRSILDTGALARLAECGAFTSFNPERRQALWSAYGVESSDLEELSLPTDKTPASLTPLSTFEAINWDYNIVSHSSCGHPLGPLRRQLNAMSLPAAETVRNLDDGHLVNYAGMVICRQRPSTANGVVFMTLEDETGFLNLIIWQKVFREFQVIAKTQSFLGVTGKLQVAQDNVHLVVEKLWIPEIDLQPEHGSRDFH